MKYTFKGFKVSVKMEGKGEVNLSLEGIEVDMSVEEFLGQFEKLKEIAIVAPKIVGDIAEIIERDNIARGDRNREEYDNRRASEAKEYDRRQALEAAEFDRRMNVKNAKEESVQ